MTDIRRRLECLRESGRRFPEVSIVVPVNAQEDLENVLNLIGDIAEYSGEHSIELILVVNNYTPGNRPPAIKTYRKMGVSVLGIPNVRRPGEAPGFSARIPGIEIAGSENIISFDADCRVPDATSLIDWYVQQFEDGASAAYTHVGYYALKVGGWIKLRMFIHHLARQVKRDVLGIPTIRGSNYAVRRSLILRLYDQGVLADDLNVGPGVKSLRFSRVAYSGEGRLRVQTSGRRFNNSGGKRLARYFYYRLRYNLRVLPVRKNTAAHTGRGSGTVQDDRYNKPAVIEDTIRNTSE